MKAAGEGEEGRNVLTTGQARMNPARMRVISSQRAIVHVQYVLQTDAGATVLLRVRRVTQLTLCARKETLLLPPVWFSG